MPIPEKVLTALKNSLEGDVVFDEVTLNRYSTDASLFVVKPALVIYPKNSEDIKKVVKIVGLHKKDCPDLSITPRAAGTCMSGGPLNKSIILDITRYMQGETKIVGNMAETLPGTFYRDFEQETLKTNQILASFTASRDLNTIGGMVGNNSGGEKNLRFGKTEKYLKQSSIILADGKEYEVKPLTKEELDQVMKRDDLWGRLHSDLFKLITDNLEIIKKAKPKVSKNSAGYYLWHVWDGQTFDLNKLIVGSQGTLGITSRVKLELVPVEKHQQLLVVFLPGLKQISQVINDVLTFGPTSLESYDQHTFGLALRFLPELIKKMKLKNLFKLSLSFWPEFKMFLRGGVPKLVLLVEFTGGDEKDLSQKVATLDKKLKSYQVTTHRANNDTEIEKYWTIRRESFSLLREHIKGKRTAPFIDDIIVRPEFLPQFLPQLQTILDEYDLIYTIAGHAGDGNFHIIPLMDMTDSKNHEVILELSDKVYDLVLKFEGSITAEHNDGIIRTPYLEQMYGSEIVALFKEVKHIFDPSNIFNPGKKVGGTKTDVKKYLSHH